MKPNGFSNTGRQSQDLSILVGGCFNQPQLEKYESVKMVHLPQVGLKILKKLTPPPRYLIARGNGLSKKKLLRLVPPIWVPRSICRDDFFSTNSGNSVRPKNPWKLVLVLDSRVANCRFAISQKIYMQVVNCYLPIETMKLRRIQVSRHPGYLSTNS